MADGQSIILPMRAAYEFGNAHGLEKQMSAIRDMDIEWDLSYTSSVRRGYVVELFESKGLFEQFKKECWAGGDTPGGEGKIGWYRRLKRRYEDFLSGRGPDAEGHANTEEHSAEEKEYEFAVEAHLRDFLAKNLERIEPGLRLHSSSESNGIEYPVDGGRIDLLAVDKGGKYVVIELKLSRGRNRALGQLLYYMGWVDQHLGKGPCRGFIIASEITEDLLVAVARAPGVKLAKYRMNFSIELR